jgi:hypothetical protein
MAADRLKDRASLRTLRSYPLALALALTLFPCQRTIPILKRLGYWLGLRYE